MTKADRIYVGPEVARRLKVEAAKQGLTIGRLVELILDRAVWGDVDDCPKCGDSGIVCYCGGCETMLTPMGVMLEGAKDD